MKTFASGNDWHIARPGSDIVDDRSLHPGNEEMCSFTYNLVQHSRKPIKDDSSVSTFNCKD